MADEQSDETELKSESPFKKAERSEKDREVLETPIGKVVGGREAADRFKDLLAKTLRIQK